jgi:hypothetical protein
MYVEAVVQLFSIKVPVSASTSTLPAKTLSKIPVWQQGSCHVISTAVMGVHMACRDAEADL